MSLSPGLRAARGTPRGLGLLLAAALAVSAAVAFAAGTRRSWFERHVSEAWPAPAAPAARAALPADARALRGAIRVLDVPAKRALYVGWMADPGSLPADGAAAMFDADAEAFSEWAARTLLHGSRAQRVRAIAFLVASRHPAALAPLREAADRAERRREIDFMDDARRAASTLETEISTERTRRRSTTWPGA
jgi:hypothetical protein